MLESSRVLDQPNFTILTFIMNNTTRSYVKWTTRQTELVLAGMMDYLDEEYPGYTLPNEQSTVGLEFVREALRAVQQRVLDKDYHKKYFSREFQLNICREFTRRVWRRQCERKKTAALLEDASFDELVTAVAAKYESSVLEKLLASLEEKLLPAVLSRVEEVVRIEMARAAAPSRRVEMDTVSESQTKTRILVVGLLPSQQHDMDALIGEKLAKHTDLDSQWDIEYMDAGKSLNHLAAKAKGRHVFLTRFVNHSHVEVAKKNGLTHRVMFGGFGELSQMANHIVNLIVHEAGKKGLNE